MYTLLRRPSMFFNTSVEMKQKKLNNEIAKRKTIQWQKQAKQILSLYEIWTLASIEAFH